MQASAAGRHLLGVELADGDVGRHGELAPRPDVARVEVARRDRRLGPHHRQAPRRLALEDRPRQRRRAAVAADAGVRDPRGPARADRRRHDLLQEGAEDHVRTGQLGEPQHVVGAQRRFEPQVLGADDFVAVITQAGPQGLGHPTKAGVDERYPDVFRVSHVIPRPAVADTALSATFPITSWFAASGRA